MKQEGWFLRTQSSDCWSICNGALERTVSYFKRIPAYRQWGWKSLNLKQFLRGDVLDIGAGHANYYLNIKSNRNRVILLDPTYDNVRKPFKQLPIFMSINGDGLLLPIQDGSVDSALCLATIHHIPTRECRSIFLREIYRVLRPGGTLVLTVWSPEPFPDGEAVCDGVVLSSKMGERFYHFYSQQELREDLESTGFQVMSLETFVENPRKPYWTKNLLAISHK